MLFRDRATPGSAQVRDLESPPQWSVPARRTHVRLACSSDETRRFHSAQPQRRRQRVPLARLQALDRLGDGLDVRRRRAAAAADDVQPAVLGPALDQLGRHLGRLVIGAELVGQAGVGIDADQAVDLRVERIDVGMQLGGAEAAVQAHGERLGVAHRMPERLDGLARQVAAGEVGQGHRDHHRDDLAARLARLVGGEDGGLGVQGVEHRLDQDEVDAAVEQAVDLLAIDALHLVEGDGAIAGIVDVGRDRQGLVGRAERAGDEARLARVLRRRGIGAGARDLRGGEVDLARLVLDAVVGLADRVGVEGVGRQQVGAGLDVGVADLAHDLGPRQVQQIVVALLVVRERRGRRDSRPRRAGSPGWRCRRGRP